MRKKVGILAVLGLAVFLYSCSDDIVLEEAQGIEGNYQGTYTIIENDNDTIGTQNVVVSFFEDGDWVMGVDTTNPTDFCLCRSFGRYDVSDRLRLQLNAQASVVPEPNTDSVSCTSCGTDDRPDETFQLVRQQNLLVLSQVTTLGDGTVVEKRFELTVVQ